MDLNESLNGAVTDGMKLREKAGRRAAGELWELREMWELSGFSPDFL